MKKTGIIIFLLGLSFLSLAGSFKIGAFFFKGNVYYIEKEGNNFSVMLNGRDVLTLKNLKVYYSNGKDRACFLTDRREILWVGNKRFEFKIRLNPVLDFEKLKFFRMSLKNERFFLVGDLNISVFDVDREVQYRLSSLCYFKDRGLFLIPPEDIVFHKDYFVFYSNQNLIVFSIKEKEPVLIRKFDFNFVTYADMKEGAPFFRFDYSIPLKVDLDKRRVIVYSKEKKEDILFKGRIGERKNLLVRLKVSNNGFSPELNLEFNVFQGKSLLFSKKLNNLKVDLNDLTDFRPFIFRQLEKAITLNFLDKTIVLFQNKKGQIDLEIVDNNSYFSIVNGDLFRF